MKPRRKYPMCVCVALTKHLRFRYRLVCVKINHTFADFRNKKSYYYLVTIEYPRCDSQTQSASK